MTLLWQIEQHMKASGMTATRVGREAAGDPNLVWELRRGREPGSALAARVAAWIAARTEPRA